MSQTASYYKIGLGEKFLRRAKIIFSLVLMVALGLTASATYAGVSSGKLYTSVIEPLKSFGKGFVASLEESNKDSRIPSRSTVEINVFNATSTSSSETTVNTNNQPAKSNIVKKNSIKPTSLPLPTATPTKSWEERVREMNAKADQEHQEALKRQEEWSRQKQPKTILGLSSKPLQPKERKMNGGRRSNKN